MGDKLSTLNSITSFGPTVEAAIARGKDSANQPLTVTATNRHDRALRVYNLEVESRTGQITHNYLVGDDLVWVHNVDHELDLRPTTQCRHDYGKTKKTRA